MTEEFRPIKDFERYYVSNLGRVLNTETGKFLKMIDNGNGYLKVNLYKNGKVKGFKVHQLVAKAFIPNPLGLDTIDHIGSKTDNRVSNLRWLSRSENSKRFHNEQKTEEQTEHYKETIKKAYEVCKKPVVCIETGKIYESVAQASKELNLVDSHISQVCKGKRKTVGGYHFEYLLKE